MDSSALFERVKALWPSSVTLSDDPLKALNTIYWPLESKLGHEDEWLSLAAWAFHQSLWEQVRDDPLSWGGTLTIADVPFSIFDRNMRKNLADPSWSEERAAYGEASI